MFDRMIILRNLTTFSRRYFEIIFVIYLCNILVYVVYIHTKVNVAEKKSATKRNADKRSKTIKLFIIGLIKLYVLDILL